MFFIWTAILEDQIAGKNNKIKPQKLINIIWNQVCGERYKNGVFNSSSTSNILFEEFGYV